MRNSWWLFGYLQVMDCLTTVSFLNRGKHEGNPLVKYALAAIHPSILALLIFKGTLLMLAMAILGLMDKKVSPLNLRVLNIAGAAVVFWNVLGNLS